MSENVQKFILIAQCILNPDCKVQNVSQSFSLAEDLMIYLLRNHIGIVQYPCPEITTEDIDKQKNNCIKDEKNCIHINFREKYIESNKSFFKMIIDNIEKGFKLIGCIGIENSPTCGVKLIYINEDNDHNREIIPDYKVDENSKLLMGIINEIINEELKKIGIVIPFLEFPSDSEQGSLKSNLFWQALQKVITDDN